VIDVGEMHYVDRSYVLTEVPADYHGLFGLRTAMNDKSCANDPLVTLTATGTVEVIVAASADDERPSWMSSWTITGETIVADHDPYGAAEFDLLSQSYPAGLVELGPCADDTGVMYFVMFR